ncbi:MAG: hypothetical protein ACTHVE_05005 [Senegalia sp. (in: firmicutes)]|uniref:hypothetical protein n=1 Tax=Senegalia sp. (in: firmicutes) TaxID=1924098 RepID=UPI003F97247C
MKKSTSLFFIVTFFIVMTLILFLSYKVIPISHQKTDSKLSEKNIDNYFSDNIKEKTKAIESIKEIVLSDLGFKEWMDYKEYMSILVFPSDLKNENIDLIIGLNLSKDTGVIALYEKQNDKYVLQDSIKDLSYIDYIKTKEFNDKFLLIVEETIDEKLGGYFYDERLVIYYKQEDFKKVFDKTKVYESYLYEGWKKEKIKNPKWFKLTENNIIDIVEKDNLNIDLHKELNIYTSDESSTSIPSNFKEYKNKNLKLNYTWDKDFNYFIQNKGIITSTKESVGIISMSNQSVDYYLDNEKILYKIIDKKGDVRYEDSDKIRVLEK